jgi:hypothetical protein
MNLKADLSGSWEGYYTQHEARRPIAAELVQHGVEIEGTMVDEVTEFDMAISEFALLEGLPPGADEQIVAKIRALHPDAPPGPVHAETELPSDSVVEGTFDGETVRLTKTYQGDHYAGYTIGDLRVRWKVEGHQVVYEGQVSADGTEIEGRWRIPSGPDPQAHPIRTEGGFYLKRTDVGR